MTWSPVTFLHMIIRRRLDVQCGNVNELKAKRSVFIIVILGVDLLWIDFGRSLNYRVEFDVDFWNNWPQKSGPAERRFLIPAQEDLCTFFLLQHTWSGSRQTFVSSVSSDRHVKTRRTVPGRISIRLLQRTSVACITQNILPPLNARLIHECIHTNVMLCIQLSLMCLA